MEFRYDYNVNNRTLQIHDVSDDSIYTTQDFAAIVAFHGYVGWVENDSHLDVYIANYIKNYSHKLRHYK